MRARTLALILFVVSLAAILLLLTLLFRVQIQQPSSAADTANVPDIPLVEVKVELPTAEPELPVFAAGWGPTIDIMQWKSWGEPLPVIKERKGRNDSWALDPSGDGNYSSGIVSRFLLDLRQGAAVEFWARAVTSHQYWQSADIGISQAADATAYAGITQQPVPFVGIHIGAETDQDYIEYFAGSERQREAYTPLNDQWHHYRLEIDADGSVRFYRDGELKFAPESKLDLDLYGRRPLSIEGRSYQTDVLIDDVAVYGVIVPPASLTLDALAPDYAAGVVVSGDWESIRHVILPDFDGDGDGDMVVASTGASNRIIALETDAQTAPTTWRRQLIGKTSATLFQLASLDFDGDGDLDVVSTTGPDESAELILWQNNGDPFARPWTRIDIGASSTELLSVLAVDLDADGDPDLVTGSDGAADVELVIWENPGVTGAAWPRHELGAAGDSVYVVRPIDLDADGDTDLVTGARRDAPHEIVAWINDGAPMDGGWENAPVGAAPGDVYALAVADFDNDANTDLASAGSSHGDPQVLLWKNDGTPLNDEWQHNAVATLQRSVLTVLAGDVDADGRTDLLASTDNAPQAAEIGVWLSGDSPDATHWTYLPVGETGQDTRLAAGDLDGDGASDLVSFGNKLLVIWQRNPARSP